MFPSPEELQTWVNLHSDPMYVLEQNKRYEHVTTLMSQMQRVGKLIANYTQTGRQLCVDLHNIVTELRTIEFVATNTTLESLISSIDGIQTGLHLHFREMENTAQNSIECFMKEDAVELSELHKVHQKSTEKFHRKQEKYLSLSKKAKEKKVNKKHVKLVDAEEGSSKALINFANGIEEAEGKLKSLIEGFVVSYAKSFTGATRELSEVASQFAEKLTSQRDLVASPRRRNMKVKRKSLSECFVKLREKQNSHYENTECKTQKQGYLWRRMKFGWEKQYCVCSAGVMSASPSPETAHNPSWTLNLLYCSAAPALNESRQNCFTINSKDKCYLFQATSRYDMEEWLNVIQNGVARVLMEPDVPIPQATSPTGSSDCCADCKRETATWVLMNKFMILCDECAGIHRAMPTISTVKSLTLDRIDRYTTQILTLVKGNPLNAYLEKNAADAAIPSDSPYEERHRYIDKKYVEHAYADRELNVDIFEAIRRHDLKELIIAIETGQLMNQPKDKFGPVHAAACIGDPLVLHILLQNMGRINSLDENGWSPLSYAAFHNNKAACDVLLEFAASQIASKVAHPYLIAKEKGHTKIMELLRDPGSDEYKQDGFALPNQEFMPEEVPVEHVVQDPVEETPVSPSVDVEQGLNNAIMAIRQTRRRGSTLVRKRPDLKL